MPVRMILAMRQLTSLDQQFLALEDGRTHGHVSALGMYATALRFRGS